MIGLILTCIFGLLLIDFCLVGIVPPILKVWPSIKALGSSTPLIDGSLSWARTNMQGKFIKPMVNQRMGYQSATLTKEHFYLRPNRLNYILKIDVPSISAMEIKKEIIGKSITLRFSQDGTERFFTLKPKKFAEWVSCFESLGIPKKEI